MTPTRTHVYILRALRTESYILCFILRMEISLKVWNAAAREEMNSRGAEEEAETLDGQTNQKHSIINKPYYRSASVLTD